MTTKGKKLLGKGLFSKVYDNGDDTVTIVSCDSAKECMALFPVDSSRFPTVTRVECDEYSTYTMKKYDKVKGIQTKVNYYDWSLFKWLRDNLNKTIGYNAIVDALEFDMPNEFDEDREVLLDMVDHMANYGDDISFEISPRNVAIDNGRLVFLDVFFFADHASKLHREKVRNNHNRYR